jgi:hypothetical protein
MKSVTIVVVLSLLPKGKHFIFSLNGKKIAETEDDFALMHILCLGRDVFGNF